MQACALALASDTSTVTAVRAAHPAGDVPPERHSEVFMGASLDHAVWFHRPARADDWLLMDITCHSVMGARGLSFGHVFDRQRAPRGLHRAGGPAAGAASVARRRPSHRHVRDRVGAAGAAGIGATVRAMRLGMSLTTNYGDYPDARLAARHAVERAAAARASELDHLFVGDHHGNAMPYLQNVPILARMLAEWGDAPAGCLFLLPLWNPVLLAEQVATLACLQQRPFHRPVRHRHRPPAVRGDGHDAADPTLRLRGVPRHLPAPVGRRDGQLRGSLPAVRSQHRTPAAGTARGLARLRPGRHGAGGPPGRRLAVRPRHAAGGDAGPRSTPTWATAPRPAGRPSAVALRRDVYVGADRADAQAVKDRAVAAGYRGFPPEALVAGTAEEVAEQLAAFAALGVTDICCRHFTNDQALVLGSLERLGEVRRLVAAL